MTNNDTATKPNPSAREICAHPVHLLAFGFGAGLAPKAPGTFGTLVGVLAYLPLQSLSLPAYVSITALLCAAGVWICGKSAERLGIHDHPGIVWDEIAGLLITMTAAPAGWIWIAVGFVLFRLFDILKPWPIRIVDRRIKGGFGIMLDDILAGLFASAVLQSIQLVL
jgi:phosphatidylglycerophosphatase A